MPVQGCSKIKEGLLSQCIHRHKYKLPNFQINLPVFQNKAETCKYQWKSRTCDAIHFDCFQSFKSNYLKNFFMNYAEFDFVAQFWSI